MKVLSFCEIGCTMPFMATKKRKRRKSKSKKRKMRKSFLLFCIFVIVVCLLGVFQDNRQKKQEETPVESNLVKNTYDWSKLKKDGSFLSYDDENYTSMQGIDVSSHQEWIDWEKVKKSGIQFAYLRVGYRGYETGIIHKDTYFDYNIQSCIKYGIQVGVYFFSQATTMDEAREEAEFTLSQIKNYQIDLPVCYDIEQAGEGKGRVDQLSKETWTENAVTFLHVVQNAGYKAMNYNSASLFEDYFQLEYMQEFDTWVAHYNTDYPNYPYTFLIWQYSCTGQVDGIDGDGTDMDIMFVKKGE